MSVKLVISMFFAVLMAVSSSGESFLFKDLAGLKGPFDGIDAKGHVLAIEKLGMVRGIPLCAAWCSDGRGNSPLFGRGWRIPLLECRLVPTDEGNYEFVQPDGMVRELRKSKADPERLVANRIWSGRVKGDEITLLGDLGKTEERIELVFRKGRLARMKTEEGSFDFLTVGKQVEKISSKGRVLLAVVKDAHNADRFELVFDGKVKVAGTRRSAAVFAGEGRTSAEPVLAELMWPNGFRRCFEYGTKGDKATFTTSGRVFVWDSYKRTVVAHDGWTYEIGACKPEWNNPKITRRRNDGASETYWFNLVEGKGEYETPAGERYVWAKFPSGDLYGLMRWSEKTQGGGLLHRSEFTYDSSRRLVYRRFMRGDAERQGGSLPALEENWYAADGQVRRMRVDGKEIAP